MSRKLSGPYRATAFTSEYSHKEKKNVRGVGGKNPRTHHRFCGITPVKIGLCSRLNTTL
jgi:hypothetical protein